MDRPDTTSPYEYRDDKLSLGLVLAEFLGIWRPKTASNPEDALHALCDREELPEAMRAALRRDLRL